MRGGLEKAASLARLVRREEEEGRAKSVSHSAASGPALRSCPYSGRSVKSPIAGIASQIANVIIAPALLSA